MTKLMQFAQSSLQDFRQRGPIVVQEWRDRTAANPLQHFPNAVLTMREKYGPELRVVLLGHDPIMGDTFVEAMRPHFDIVGCVSNARTGMKSFALKDLISLRSKGEFVAVNCVTYDYHQKLAYDSFCDKQAIPSISFHQMIRLVDANFEVAVQKRYFQNCYAQTIEHLDAHLRLFEKLLDAKSREVYFGLLMNRLTGSEDFLTLIASPLSEIYFECVNRHRPDAIFCDGGALDGRDTKNFFRNFGENAKFAHVFEPSDVNADQTEANLEEELAGRFKVHRAAIGEASGWTKLTGFSDKGYMDPSDITTTMGDNSNIRVGTIDELAGDANVIKLEVEGAEKSALIGATNTIRTRRPDLIVSAYHTADDFLVLPAAIGDRTDDDYTWKLRHHTLCFSHSVFYVVPPIAE